MGCMCCGVPSKNEAKPMLNVVDYHHSESALFDFLQYSGLVFVQLSPYKPPIQEIPLSITFTNDSNDHI